MDLLEALEREYRQREQDYHIAKKHLSGDNRDNSLIPSLAIMNAIQRVLERAGLPRFEEREDK